jgi:hypothetical protein
MQKVLDSRRERLREQAIERSVGKRQDAARLRRSETDDGEDYCAACGGPCLVYPPSLWDRIERKRRELDRIALDRSIKRAIEDHQGGVHTSLGTGPCPGCPLCPAVAVVA